MPQFAIMRCKKLASMGSVAGALKHCYRERETPTDTTTDTDTDTSTPQPAPEED